MLSLRNLLLVAAAIRAGLLVYGEYQDANFPVKYTDIDYKVFTDAARFVTLGGSPYERATYRYTPLLAYMLGPNIWLHPAFGKVLFALSDLIVGWILYRIVEMRGATTKQAAYLSSLSLLNPMVANISTRGSAESLLGAMILGTLYLILQKRLMLAAVLYGLSVHFKIYPIIYSIGFLMLLDAKYDGQYAQVNGYAKDEARRQKPLMAWLIDIPSRLIAFVTPTRITFAFVSAAVFTALNIWMYTLYGDEFLDETYLYHITRRDHRHNFSLWFYQIYLTFGNEQSTLLGLLTFVPQLLLAFVIGWAFGKDIFFSCFAQTFAFVVFNKVCTAQYFMWYICLFPLIIPSSQISFRWKGATMLAAWILGQALVLGQSFKLEFLGLNSFFAIWLSSIFFFLSNCWILGQLILNHVLEPVFNSRGDIRKIYL